MAVAGCGGAAASAGGGGGQQPAGQLRGYVSAVEPIRLAVNRLLDGADPILAARAKGRIDGARAAARMGRLERRFAAYAVAIGALRAPSPRLAALNAPYAHTYVLEDAYLSALANGLAEDRLDDLPDTSAAQREAIVAWRIGLEVLARREGVSLPRDLQQAGRGEIRPSPLGAS